MCLKTRILGLITYLWLSSSLISSTLITELLILTAAMKPHQQIHSNQKEQAASFRHPSVDLCLRLILLALRVTQGSIMWNDLTFNTPASLLREIRECLDSGFWGSVFSHHTAATVSSIWCKSKKSWYDWIQKKLLKISTHVQSLLWRRRHFYTRISFRFVCLSVLWILHIHMLVSVWKALFRRSAISKYPTKHLLKLN